MRPKKTVKKTVKRQRIQSLISILNICHYSIDKGVPETTVTMMMIMMIIVEYLHDFGV